MGTQLVLASWGRAEPSVFNSRLLVSGAAGILDKCTGLE